MRHMACCLLAFCSALSADELIELSPFVVVAPNLLSVDEVWQGEQLRESKPLDLAAILSARVPSIALSRKSPLAGDIVMRGMTRDDILITVDNNKTFCACPNRMDPPAFHVSSQQIEAISIRTGPFSVNQGGTTGGAVFVRTSTAPVSEQLRGYAFLGSYGYRAGGLSGGTPLGEGAAQLQAGLYGQQGDVYEDGDGRLFTMLPGTNYQDSRVRGQAFKLVNAEAKLSVDLPGESVMKINYAVQDATDVLYPGLKMDALTDTLNRGSVGIGFKLDAELADLLNLNLAFSTVDHDMRDSFRKSALMNPAFAARGYMMRTVSETAYTGLNADARKESGGSVISYGLDLTERRWDADNVIMTMENAMLPDVRTQAIGLWSVIERSRDNLKYEAGFRIDFAESKARDDISFIQAVRGTSTNKVDELLGSAYLLADYKLSDRTSLFAGIGHGERLPDPQERLMNLNRPGSNPDWVGNPDLDPVKNTELQLGGRFQSGALSTSLSLFHAWLADYIYLTGIQTADTTATTYENIDARIYGLSGELAVRLNDQWLFRTAVAWQEGVKSSTLPGSTNDRLAEVPPLRALFSLAWKADSLSVVLSAQFQDDLSRIDPDLNEQPIDSSWVSNLAAHWELNPRLTISAGLDNLFDEAYAVANSHLRDPFSSSVIVNEPGRVFFLRVSAEY